MNYIYIDGDNIGLKIEQSFLNNNEAELIEINFKVINAVKQISFYLKSCNQEIIFSGADGIISKGIEINIHDLLKTVRTIDPDLTFSIGIGSSLKESYIALRYAKSYKKNIAISLLEGMDFVIINQ